VLGVALGLNVVDFGFNPLCLVMDLPDDLYGRVIGEFALGESDR
jgi:hypothetical protein